MRKLLYTFLFTCLVSTLHAKPQKADVSPVLTFEVLKQVKSAYTTYEFRSLNESFGSVVTFPGMMGREFELYSSSGTQEASGITLLPSIQANLQSNSETYVFNPKSLRIGYFNGNMEPGGNLVIDCHNSEAALVHVNSDMTNFIIVDPNHIEHCFVVVQCVDAYGQVWKVDVFEKNVIDIRVLKIFAAFAAQSQVKL